MVFLFLIILAFLTYAILGELEGSQEPLAPASGCCPGCSEAVDADWLLCPRCRTLIRETCADCGRATIAYHRFCPWCGGSGRAGEER